MQTKTQKMVSTALMAALLAVLSPFVIPIGLVPITLALFAVFLTGTLLPPLYAVASIAVYLLIGFVGAPVFSGFIGGPQVLLGPTGGYLFGYFIIALAVSLSIRISKKWWVWAAGALLGLAGCYLVGTLWFMLMMHSAFLPALTACVVPFIIPDVIKAGAALSLGAVLNARLGTRRNRA